MRYAPPPLPSDSRVTKTQELIARKGTDLARWSELESLATQWDSRAAMAAEWIPAGVRVLDIGCGAMTLSALLKSNCTYIPADLVERRPGCHVIDLNQRQFPPGQYDWVVLLGVLEYIHEPAWALVRASDAAPNLLVTYCTAVGESIAVRRGMGWVNDLNQDDFEDLLGSNGWSIARVAEVKRGPSNVQLMYACVRTL
jgi:Methyltransferase domain